ncbi:winged helix-turn-helix transcriptional regulator [Methylobacterium sp. BE186]|uniref:winged helix-turn-helix transcriptional regulator n=1 Tax=Methylobacterium sp. BE186 TaxID=2817715 RepID=UPI00286BFCD1|nr:winged helix-turn-helix transcriptional regulator [Methylobacterium sp. BE186]
MKLEKVTEGSRTSRRYEDACAAAHALDLVGERWALLVMRELMLGPKRFSDLRADLPGISANVLTQRLEGLEAVGILVRRRLPPPAGSQVYALTPWGSESEPIFQALGRWAARSPLHDPSLPFSATSLFLSLRTMLDPGRAAGLSARIGFRIGAETYLARVADGAITVERGPLEGADLVFSGPAPVIAAAIYGGQSFEALAGALSLEGDRALAERFVTLFPLPPKATSEASAPEWRAPPP